MDYSKVKFKYGKSGALEGWYEGKKIGEIFTMGDNVIAGESGARNDGWVTMSGLHVLIDDATGQIASGPLKGKTYTPVLQTKKQKSDLKKAAKAAKKAISSAPKGSSGSGSTAKSAKTTTKKTSKAISRLGNETTIEVGGVKYKKSAANKWVDTQTGGSTKTDDEMATVCATAGARNVKISSASYSRAAVGNKLNTLKAGTEITMITGSGVKTFTADGNGNFKDATGGTYQTDTMAAAACMTGLSACTIKMPSKTQNTTQATQNSSTQSQTAQSSGSQSSSAASLQSTLQQNAKTMKLAQFKQSMKSGMDAATPGTKVDWGGKTYQKQSDGSWQYVDSNGKTHQTSAKQIAHLATLKGANGQAPTSRAQAVKSAMQTTNTAQGQSGATGKGVDANGNITSNVGTNNGKQKVMGKVTPNENLKKITNDAGDHQVAEGKDITGTVKTNPKSEWNAFEQIAYQQGYKNPPQVVTDKATFEKMVKESGVIMYRAENDNSSKTGKQMIEDMKNYDADKQKSNWSGGKAHGYGVYYATNKGGLTSSSEKAAQKGSIGYLWDKGAQYKATLQKGAKIISEADAQKMYQKAYSKAKDKDAFARKYGARISTKDDDKCGASAYAAAKGYDAIRCKIGSDHEYTTVLNVSKLVIYDVNVVEQ